MAETAKCLMCATEAGQHHPVTGRPVEGLVANNRRTAFICFDCVARCVEIMASGEEPGDAVREEHEPVFYAEEGIIRSQRAARHRLAAEARAQAQKASDDPGR